MNKTPTHISLLSLLLNSKSHRSLLLKVLNEAHVPQDITIERFRGIINNITSRGCVTFSEEKVPTEGRRHNQPLHIFVKCGDYMIARVLIDNGSSLNVLPKSTLDKLCSVNSQLSVSLVVVRAFDGSKRDVMREITLPIYVGPTLFGIVFQVMDICSAYSCILGRPWIHMAGAVPSSLHQRVKFIVDHQLVGVMGEKELVISTPLLEGYIEGNEEALETSFQSLEFTTTPSPGSENPTPPSVAKDMTFRVMIKEGYHPGKGLGLHLNGIPTPIVMRENMGKARLGYHRDNQEGNLASFQEEPTLTQCFVWGGVAMIGDEPTSQQEEVFVTQDPLANWTVEVLPDGYLFKIANNEPSLSGNVIRMCEDHSRTNEPVEDEGTEAEALMEMERQIEWEKPKFQLLAEELKSINLGNEIEKKEVRVGKQMPPNLRMKLMELLKEFTDLRRIKPNIALKIKEEVEKQWSVGFLTVANYPQWVANIVPVPKKDGKVRMCVNYRDLNRAIPKENFPLPHIDVLVHNTAQHVFFSFMDGFSGYNQILMAQED
ncbi:hypothetical protein CR513_04322, partial [Mucuna pruriens]